MSDKYFSAILTIPRFSTAETNPTKRTTHVRDTFCVEWDKAHGAKLVDFHGWNLPVSYEKGILYEHEATRTRAGLYNISHMGRVWVTGPEALTFSNSAFTNDLVPTALGSAEYGMLLNERGGVIDDVILYKESPERIFWVVNATNIAADVAQLKKLAAGRRVAVDNISDSTSMMALQGPLATQALSAVLKGADPAAMPYFSFARGTVRGREVLVMATGYTGEDGYEVLAKNEDAQEVWNALTERPEVEPCGLGARDSLRLEAGLPLHGNEMDPSIQPTETNLMWAVKMDKPGGFFGREALNLDPPRKRVALTLTVPGIPREKYRVLSDGKDVGVVSSGVYSPTLKKGIAFAFVKKEFLEKPLAVEIRGKAAPVVRQKGAWVRHVTKKKAPKTT